MPPHKLNVPSMLDTFEAQLKVRGYTPTRRNALPPSGCRSCTASCSISRQPAAPSCASCCRVRSRRAVSTCLAGVGRGKSFLMDCFFDAVPLSSQDARAFPRVHARGAPRGAKMHKHEVDPLDELAAHRAGATSCSASTSSTYPTSPTR
jgi:hypothetical protein